MADFSLLHERQSYMTVIEDTNSHAIKSRHPLIKNVDRVLVPAEMIQARIAELGRQITEDYKGEDLVIIGVLKGAMPFMSDLVRHIDMPLVMDYVATSSYAGGTTSSGVVRFQKDVEEPLEGRSVIIVEDIVDTGFTLHYLSKIFKLRGPKSLEICTLVDKPARRKTDVAPKYVGFTIPDRFILGYGMDYEESYRNLDFIGIMSPEAIKG